MTNLTCVTMKHHGDNDQPVMATVKIKQVTSLNDHGDNDQLAMATMNIGLVMFSGDNENRYQPVMATAVMQPWHMASQWRDKLARSECCRWFSACWHGNC